MTATDHVLATSELLEAILLAMTHQDLLISALLVSHSWHNAIISSQPLQQRLFFAPAPAGTPWIQNPILAAKFWPFFHDIRRTDDFDKQDDAGYWDEEFQFFDSNRRYRLISTRHLGASWRKMLVLQPPVNTLRVFHHEKMFERRQVWWERRKGVYPSSDGLMMGDVFMEVVDMVDGRSTGMGIQWNMWDVEDVKHSAENTDFEDRHVVIENEPRDSVTLVYVDWFRDWSASSCRIGGPELRKMAGIQIIPGDENA